MTKLGIVLSKSTSIQCKPRLDWFRLSFFLSRPSSLAELSIFNVLYVILRVLGAGWVDRMVSRAVWGKRWALLGVGRAPWPYSSSCLSDLTLRALEFHFQRIIGRSRGSWGLIELIGLLAELFEEEVKLF